MVNYGIRKPSADLAKSRLASKKKRMDTTTIDIIITESLLHYRQLRSDTSRAKRSSNGY